MNILLAPNGKPSNLTPEQYELVRTPEFKAWFGDWENSPETSSKVIDENGEPLVVYRATKGELDYVRSGYQFFTPNKNYAKIYGDNLISCFLDIKKLLDFEYYNKIIQDNKIDCGYSNEGLFQMSNYNLEQGLIKVYQSQLGCLQFDAPELADEIYDKLNTAEGLVGYEAGHYGKAISYLVKNSNQIKLADSTNTTFDGGNPDIRYKTGGEIKDLVVLHNINDYQIEEANKIGGLITPSIAIVKSGNSFTDFGSITLIGTKELIDPENRSVKVFAGDVYSPSVPRKLWYVDKRTLEKVTTELIKKSLYYDENISKSNREIYHLVNQYIGNSSDFDRDIEKNSFNRLIEQYFEKLKLIYIVDKSIKIKVPFKDKRHFLWNNVEFKLTEEQKKRFAPILREYTNESNEKGSSGISKEIKSKVYDLFLEVLEDVKNTREYEKEDAELSDYFLKSLFESFEKTVGTRYDWSGYTEYNLSQAVWSEKELDKEKLNQNIKKIFTKDVIENYKEWLSDFISQFQGSAYFLKGNEKMPYTLNYLVDATSNRVVGQEKNMTFGVNQAKSFGTKRLNSIAEIKKNSNNLISKEEMNLIDKKKSDNFFSLSQSLKYSSSNDWGKLDSLSRAIADYYKGTSIVSALRKNDFSSPTSYQIDSFKYFADELKNSPVDYFEAKYQRAVSLKEFKYAVVPKNTSKEVLQILLDNGIIIKKYESEEQRLQIINTISNKDKSIKFEEGGNVNWDADRYRQVEKEMYDLQTQEKTDSAEYFKLIKERSILEKNKMEVSSDSKNYFAKGGNIIAYKKDFQKFNKIGVTDKYIIEAITEIGLQDTKFDKESIEKTIENEFKNLINSYQEYIISEDSNEISRQILFDKNARYLAGEQDENLKDFDNLINSKKRRKEEYIKKYADTQKETINEWISYLKGSEYPFAIKFLLLKSVLNFNYNYKIDDLIKRTDTTIRNFTLFDAGSLSELIASNSDYLLKDYTKIQLENSEKILKSKELLKTSGDGTWLKFNGGSNTTEEEILKNSIELSQLVQNTYWCTKTNSKSQLDGGDFYVYVTKNNGEIFPRIAIRMEGDLVGEVRGNKSSAQDIEEEMLPIAEEFLLNNLDAKSGKKWLDGIDYNNSAIKLNEKITEQGLYKNSIEEFIELKSKEKQNLLDYADRNGHIVRIEKLVEGLVPTLPNEFYGEKEVVIDLSKFDNKKTKIIIGDAIFQDSQVTDLGQLTTIDGGANFYKSQVKDLGQLTTIGGDAIFQDSQVTDLGQLTTIGGDAYFRDSQIKSLGELTTIGGFADFRNSQVKNLGQLSTISGGAIFTDSKIKNLGQLSTIGRYADFNDSQITDLGQLTTIGDYANFQNSQVTDLGQLTTIGGRAYFQNSQVTDLGNLQYIGSDADFEYSRIKNLGKLTTIGGDAYFKDSQITDLGQLTTIGGDANFKDSQITDLGQLTTIGRDVFFGNSQITDLGQLTTIGGDAIFRDSQITDLGQLTTIGGDAYFRDSKITDLGQLTTIGGDANFIYSKITDLGQLTTIGGDAYFEGSQVKNLGQLPMIGGNANFKNSKITDLGQLTTIGSDANFTDSQITDLGQLTTIGGNANFIDSKITDLGELTTIGGVANFQNSQITDLGELTTIGGDAFFRESQITDLGELTSIGGYAYFEGSQITDLGQLTTIGDYADFEGSQVKNLGQLTTIGGTANFRESQITDLGKLTTIGGDAYFGERTDLETEWEKIKNRTKNMENYSTEKFAKGGKILIKQITTNGNTINVHKDFEKFKRIGIEDKYLIEASNDIGLQGVVFNKLSLFKKITDSFNTLLENYNDYIISKDSEGITFEIENNIKELQIGGSSLEVIQKERDKLTNEFERLKIMQDFANTQREALDKWIDYLGQSDYPQAFLYLMLKAVLNYNYDLKLNKLFERTNETTRNITPFDAGTLSDLFYSNSNYLLQDYAQLMSENAQKILNSKEVIDETDKGKWIKFNGGSKTPPSEIEKNGKQLMQLVQNTYWCTKNAGEQQLKGGDFYVYVTESSGDVLPQIAVRMNENEVGEIRGNESSSQDLSAESLPIARKFLTKNIPNNSGKRWLDSIEYNQRCVDMGNRFEQEGLYENFISDYLELLSQKSKYQVDYGDNGNVVGMVRKFEEAKEKLPNQYYERGDIESNYLLISPLTKYFIGNLGRYEMQTLSSQNINLSDLSNWKLKFISGSFDCADIVTTLGNIEFVGNDLTLSQITNDFGSVKHIGGRFDMGSAQITSLVNIESIGSGFVVNSNLTDLGKLKKIGWLTVLSCGEQFTFGDLEEVKGDLSIKVSDKNFDVGNLKIVGGSFDASKTLLTDLKGLESVGNDFSIAGSKIKLFENLKTIGGNADFSNNFSSSTQNIESILGNIKLLNSRIMDFPKLSIVGGNIELRGSYLKSFGNIKSIGSNLDLVEGKIEDLGNLEEINGFINFKGSQVKSLNKLKKIVLFANFSDSLVEDLGNLESIGGNAYFNDTNIKSIGKLKYIGGFAQFGGNPTLEEQWKKIKNAE